MTISDAARDRISQNNITLMFWGIYWLDFPSSSQREYNRNTEVQKDNHRIMIGLSFWKIWFFNHVHCSVTFLFTRNVDITWISRFLIYKADALVVHIETEIKSIAISQTISNAFFMNENVWISLKISLKCVPKVRIDNIPALVQIMACRLVGALFSLLTHICATRPQWVKWASGYCVKKLWR